MLGGDEKRIRALFCELALEDRGDTLPFEKLWQCAEVTAQFSTVRVSKWPSLKFETLRHSFSTVRGSKWPSLKVTSGRLLQQRVLNASLRGRKLVVVITILVATVLVSIAFWSQSRKSDRVVASIPANTPVLKTVSEEKPGKVIFTAPSKPHVYKAARRRTRHIAKDAIVQNAATISSWQSPTAALLVSPAAPILNSLPQLNQSARELESFLPNDAGKESNQ